MDDIINALEQLRHDEPDHQPERAINHAQQKLLIKAAHLLPQYNSIPDEIAEARDSVFSDDDYDDLACPDF